jgi:AP-3 complex subunit beta
MSNLGSIGSKDFSPEAKIPINPVTGEPATTTTDQAINQVTEMFRSPNFQDHTEALKLLLALMSKGNDVHDFAPLVVQQVASVDPFARQLAYIYLNHYADEANDTIVLSVNTYQRALTDSDPMCRALAVKVMSSIRSREVLPAVVEAINQVIGDPSPYVKKAAAYAMIKAAELSEDQSETEALLPLLQRLLGDKSPIAFSGAIAAYWSLCPDNIELLHPHFRYICQNISKLDPWAQVFTLRALTVYARYCFRNPDTIDEDDDAGAFWDDAGTSQQSISADHLLLIYAAKKLLLSPNNAVATAATSLLFYCAPSSHVSSVAKPMVRMLYDSQIMSQLALTSILTIATVHNHIFVPQLNHFFIRRNDTTTTKNLKLRVLSLLASPSNADMILNELSKYTGSIDTEFAANAVKTMGKTATVNEAIIPACLVSLLRLMGRADGAVLSEVVLVIATILRKRRGTEDEAQALRQLCKKFLLVKDPSARAAVLSIVGDMYETHPEFAPQLLRYVAQNFLEEPGEVRLQALTLAAKLLSCGYDSAIPMYVLKVGERDSEFDIRDRARFLLCIVESDCEDIKAHIKELLFPVRKAPTWTAIDSGVSEFQLGTFSHFFNRAVSGYDPLPDWAPEDQLPEESVRTPDEREEDEGNGTGANDNLELSDFFSGDDEEEEYYDYGSYEEDEEEQGDSVPENDAFFA